MSTILCLSAMIYGACWILLQTTSLDKEEDYSLSQKEQLLLQGVCFTNGFVIQILQKYLLSSEKIVGTDLAYTFLEGLLLCIFAGGLLMASITDLKNCKVYNYTWWISGGVGGLLLILGFVGGGRMPGEVWRELWDVLLFGIIQEKLFSRMYGRADCHAFLACAIVECALGMHLKDFLVHMLLAFGLLAIIQLVRGNVAGNGNLKQAVPFLPYITSSFWLLLTVKCLLSNISIIDIDF